MAQREFEQHDDIEVLVDGIWCPGEVRMVHRDGRLNIQYRRPDRQQCLDNFPVSVVRHDTVDRSRGRG